MLSNFRSIVADQVPADVVYSIQIRQARAFHPITNDAAAIAQCSETGQISIYAMQGHY